MNLNYVLEDEKGNAGQNISLTQSEIKTVKVFWFYKNGVPYAPTSITAMTVEIFKGASISPLLKTILNGDITLLNGLGGYIGFQFNLTASDTATLPVSSTVGMSVIVIASGAEDKQDFPNAFNVGAQLVS